MTSNDPGMPPLYNAAEAGTMARREFRQGFAELGKRGLTFDAWLFQSQLHELVDLARSCAGSSIVLDHLGGPLGMGRYAGRRAEAFAEWKASMAVVATCPNISVKLGGLYMAFPGLASVDAPCPLGSKDMAAIQRDYILTAIDLFGPHRCMFESNFPVDMLFTSYTVLWNCFKRVTRDFNPTERAQLFAETARARYRIRSAAAVNCSAAPQASGTKRTHWE
jgi:L-fuconolactonase